MTKLVDFACWYCDIAIVISAYQAYRGFMFQWIFSKGRKYGQSELSTTRRVILLCLADMFTYLISALSGFLSLFYAYELAISAPSLATSGPLIFLALYGLLGITAKLPDLLQKIKVPYLE
jgi:hypothetical protein